MAKGLAEDRAVSYFTFKTLYGCLPSLLCAFTESFIGSQSSLSLFGVTGKVEPVHWSEKTEDDGTNVLLPAFPDSQRFVEQVNKLNLHGKSTPLF